MKTKILKANKEYWCKGDQPLDSSILFLKTMIRTRISSKIKNNL
jgi:hypothetical protein